MRRPFIGAFLGAVFACVLSLGYLGVSDSDAYLKSPGASAQVSSAAFPLTAPQGCNANTGYTFAGSSANTGLCASAADTVNISIGNTLVTQWTAGGSLIWPTDNSFDIGASAATRPRTGYFGTSLVSPLFRSNTAKVLIQGTGTGATQLATTQTTVPTCTTNCGTPGNVCVGTDTAMTCTMGTTPASGVLITFNGTWSAAPACVVQMALAGMVVGKQVLTAATTTTTITLVTNGTAPATSDKYHILCMGIS